MLIYRYKRRFVSFFCWKFLQKLLFSLPPFSPSLLRLRQSFFSYFVLLSHFLSFLFLCMASYRFGDTNKAPSVGVSSDDSPCDYRDPLPFPIVRYSEQYGDRLGSGCFFSMRLPSYLGDLRDAPTGRLRDTVLGAWIQRWWHCGGRQETDSLCHYKQMDSQHFPCFEEVGYERRLGSIIQRLWSTSYYDWPKDAGEFISFPIHVTGFILFQIFVIGRETYFEYDMHIHAWSVLVGWHNVELFAVYQLV